MPIVNGRYYINPQYGLGLERAKAADAEFRLLGGEPEPSWLDHFLGLVFTSEEQARVNQKDSESGMMESALAEQEQPLDSQQRNSPADGMTVGNSVYNETSGLRPTANAGSGSSQDLSNARAALAGVTKNRDAAGKVVGTGTAPGKLTTGEAVAVKTYPPAKQAYEDSQGAAGKASGNAAGAQNFYLDWGQGEPPWTVGKQPVKTYGPFVNASGGGDVPKGAQVRIRIYDLTGKRGNH